MQTFPGRNIKFVCVTVKPAVSTVGVSGELALLIITTGGSAYYVSVTVL